MLPTVGEWIMDHIVLCDGFNVIVDSCTHIGLGRAANEDTIFKMPTDKLAKASTMGYLWAVADGMGGNNGGKIASSMACDALQTYFDRRLPSHSRPSTKELGRHLAETVLRTDRLVRIKALSHELLNHMGTTLSCLLILEGQAIVAHVGDSRIYRWRKGYLSCLTTDHTFVQEMIDEGEVDQKDAHLHPLRNLLTQAVGTGEPLDHVDMRIDRTLPGDRFLLCTDGLYNAVDEFDIAALMASKQEADGIAEALVTHALQNKIRDNVTAVVVRFTGKGSLQ